MLPNAFLCTGWPPPPNDVPQTLVVPQLVLSPDVTDAVRSAPKPAQPRSCPAGSGPWQPFAPCFCPGSLSAELILLVAWMSLGPNHDLIAILGFYFYLCSPSPLPCAASILPPRLWDAQLLLVVSPVLALGNQRGEWWTDSGGLQAARHPSLLAVPRAWALARGGSSQGQN